MIGETNYLAVTTRPDLIFAVYQCAKYIIDPTKPHENYVKSIGRYLNKTKETGLVLTPDVLNGIEGKLECLW